MLSPRVFTVSLIVAFQSLHAFAQVPAPAPAVPMSAFSGYAIAETNPQYVAPCEKDTPFDQWLADVEKEAKANGVSQASINEALPSLTLDGDIVRRDRLQGVFSQPFLKFSDRMISQDRIKKAAKLRVKYKDLFDKVEQQSGVPAEVILAFWALESDFGADNGKFKILSAMTTLSYDCRRPGFFRPQLIYAMKLIERGDLHADQMIGNWAGEMGGTQFTPRDYYNSGIDSDGDGRVDLTTSIPDTIASTGNFLKNLGFQRGQPWIQNVKVPAEMPWAEADLTIQHPLSYWAKLGVKPAQENFPKQDLQASLLLPMGRLGPAFLAYPSFQAYLGWNAAMVYSITSACLALRLKGLPPIDRGNADVPILTGPEIVQLQTALNTLGYQAGVADGKLGTATRTAIKAAQIKYGLPADSYPSPELLQKLNNVTGVTN